MRFKKLIVKLLIADIVIGFHFHSVMVISDKNKNKMETLVGIVNDHRFYDMKSN